MNKGIACALSFIGGAASAGAGVYIYMKKWADKRLAAEVENFKANYKARPKYPVVDDIPETIVAKGEEDASERHNETRSKSSISDGPVNVEKMAYHKMASNYTKSEADLAADDEEEQVEDSPSEEDNMGGDDDIRIISLEQFEDDDEYEKVTLDWFLDGDTLVDEFADVVDDESRAACLGDVLDSVRSELPTDVNGHLIFIRNGKNRSDYQITVLWDSFQ